MRILIVSPALAAANNGNWQTAARWARYLRGAGHEVSIALAWQGEPIDLMIALHARRSAASIAAYAATGGRVVLVLTGTDLYRDIDENAEAQRSLELAYALVALQSEGPKRLPPGVRSRTRVIVQSAPALPRLPTRRRTDDLAMVGHLRAEKDPVTALRALALLSPQDPRRARLRLRIVGADREPALGRAVRDAGTLDPRIDWLGALSHGRARRVIRQSQALVLPSVMEGGANVLIEAVTSDVPVLASRIEGSVGLLGSDYEGFFPVGDAPALAGLIARFQDDPAFRDRLRAQCRRQAPSFAPALERAAVCALVDDVSAAPPS